MTRLTRSTPRQKPPTPFEPPLNIIRDLIGDIGLVSEEELQCAIVVLLEKAYTVAEGAGAPYAHGVSDR